MKGLSLAVASLLLLCPVGAQKKVSYQKDVKFAVDAIGKQCKGLLKAKKINWKKVTAPLLKESKKCKSHEQHLLLLWRLLARLEDGHASVRPLAKGKGVKLDLPQRTHGPGMFLCRVDDQIYIKNVWGAAKSAGLKPGMELSKVGGKPANKWLENRTAELRDLWSFSTDHQAFFYACHWGLADVAGTRWKVEVKEGKKKRTRTIAFAKTSQTAAGPSFRPKDLSGKRNVFYGKTDGGFGYMHVRRCKNTLPQEVDEALAAIGDVPGMILDFRGNSGGGFDHRALFGRFLPKGVKWSVGSGYASAGQNPYGGPMVVIVDATVRSAGETASGQFLEDGRAYGIGESPTAGMSSQKTTIELPSQLFSLYVSTGSNKQRFAKGKGIEGLGVVPHELVPYAPADLAAEKDTLIARAEALLREFPQKSVRYNPARHGWQASK